MLNATQSKSIAGAVKYFETVLSQGDYYLGTEVAANWNGKAAAILGLDTSKPVTKKEFEALLRGRHPETGKKLAQRIRQDRRPGIDFTFSVPKSVSIAWAATEDERILAALRETVRETMTKDVEPLIHRRVRDGANVNTTNRKQTGNMVYADFLHKTSRPVDGVVDPHLHVHAFALNLTMDGNRCFAAEYAEAMRQLPSLQAKFDARLAKRLESELGYAVEKVAFKQSGRMKTGWELKGIDRSTIEKFSLRTKQIEDAAAAECISDAEAKSKLGKKTRQKKDSELPVEQLHELWKARLTAKERKAFAALRAGAIGNRSQDVSMNKIDVAVEFALEHHLFRQSTVEKHQIVGTALEHGLTLLPEEIDVALANADVIARTKAIDGAARHFVTTDRVLDAEGKMIAFARDSRGTRYSIKPDPHEFKRDWLNDQQKNAVNHVLHSRDTVTGVTGGAGTGKTSLMKEAVEAIESQGKNVLTFSPSTGAREVLMEEGFEAAQTVEHLLRNEKLQGTIKPGDVLWVDEAGLLDVRSMSGIFRIAEQQEARVVLSGDTRQHSSPRRGEALRLLEKQAGLNVVRIEEIQRQKGRYKKAVALISQGHEIVDESKQLTGLLAGFDLLDKMGKIKEIEPGKRYEILADQFIANQGKGKAALVVAPTHSEGEAVTEEIRSRLREAGAIGKENQEKKITQLRSLYLSDAQKREASSYSEDGMVVQFHQNAKGGFKRGERYRVGFDESSQVTLHSMAGEPVAKSLPSEYPERFEVYSESTIQLAKGDKVRFSLGGTAKDGKRRISNGRLDEIKGFDRAGNMTLKSGMTIDREYGHLDFGYVVTSHASQGKTTKLAISAMGSQSLPAINAKQFYVTVSRGSEDVVIYVDDKEQVRRAIQDAGQQLSATELVSEKPMQNQKLEARQQLEQRAYITRVQKWWQTRAVGGRRKTKRQSTGFNLNKQTSAPQFSR